LTPSYIKRREDIVFLSKDTPKSRVSMPQYTLGEMMSYATSAVGRRADLAQSDVSRMVNEAYFEVFYASSPQEAETIAVSSTTTGENKLELPTDFLEPISATLIYSTSTSTSDHSSYNTLRLVSVEDMDGRNPQPSGTPVDIAFFNSWAEIWPSPNSAFSFQLRYRAHPSDLTGTDAVPSLGTPWRRAVVLKAEEILFQYLDDPQGVQSAQLRYLDYISRIQTDEASRQKSRQLRYSVGPSWGIGGRRRV